VYCRADSARLCLSCDRHVHGANALSQRHSRTLLCHGCNMHPAGVRCASCRTCFCQTCDDETHNSSMAASQHKRHGLECFTGCPSATELAALWNCDDRSESRDVDGPVASLSSSRMMDSQWGGSAGSTATRSTVGPVGRESQMSGDQKMEAANASSVTNISNVTNIPNVGPPLLVKVLVHSSFSPFLFSEPSDINEPEKSRGSICEVQNQIASCWKFVPGVCMLLQFSWLPFL
jgi:hypothetical protein